MPKTAPLRPSKTRSVGQNPANRVSGPDITVAAFRSDGVAPSPTISELERRLPTNEEIAVRAFQISEQRRQEGEPGDEISDWLRAEAELMQA